MSPWPWPLTYDLLQDSCPHSDQYLCNQRFMLLRHTVGVIGLGFNHNSAYKLKQSCHCIPKCNVIQYKKLINGILMSIKLNVSLLITFLECLAVTDGNIKTIRIWSSCKFKALSLSKTVQRKAAQHPLPTILYAWNSDLTWPVWLSRIWT